MPAAQPTSPTSAPKNAPLTMPNEIVNTVETSATWRQKTGVGTSIMLSTIAPPMSPASSAKIVSTGIAATAATTRGMTRKRTGGSPIVVSASSSSSTFIAPISAANALPVRPARTMAVTRGPSSRKSPIARRSETYTSTPNILSAAADSNARMSPRRKPMPVVTGSASNDARSNASAASRRRNRPGCTSMPRAQTVVSPRNARFSRVDSANSHARRPSASKGFISLP